MEYNILAVFKKKEVKSKALLGGIIIELIERGDKGFCQNSVKNLMESTQNE